jgi:Porin subfamily
MRARAYITADAREQTAWGTARAYVAVGVATTDVGNSLNPSILGFNRAFIQWAGITAGTAQSFFDFYEGFAVHYRGYLPSSGTGDTGWWVWAYTAQLGNGFSASISAEQRRMSQIIGVVGGPPAAGGAPVFVNGNLGTPSSTLATAACRCRTSSAISASTRPGAAPRSWAPRTRSMRIITALAQLATAFLKPAIRAIGGVGSRPRAYA